MPDSPRPSSQTGKEATKPTHPEDETKAAPAELVAAEGNAPAGTSPASSPKSVGEVSDSETSSQHATSDDKPSLAAGQSSVAAEPSTAASDAPPLPDEPVPEAADDGWSYHWNANDNSFWFHNRFTNAWQRENPRVPTNTTTETQVDSAANADGYSAVNSVAGGYNPAIHGDYDENAWYAQSTKQAQDAEQSTARDAQADPAVAYASGGNFNRSTGQWQTEDQGPDRYNDEAKSKRQMNAYFDVDAAANAHDGRSLKAERAGKKPTKSELKMFKEKRRARKEEKRRAWLRD